MDQPEMQSKYATREEEERASQFAHPAAEATPKKARKPRAVAKKKIDRANRDAILFCIAVILSIANLLLFVKLGIPLK